MTDIDSSGYQRWNEALVEYFYSRAVAAQPAYLDAEDEAIALAGRVAGIEGDDLSASFRRAVRDTLIWEHEQLFAHHTRALRAWVNGGRGGVPPFVGLLAAFAMAAEQMHTDESLAEHNYYGRLREVLGVPEGDKKRADKVQRDFGHHASAFWDELNRWLLSEGGRRGLPTAAAFDRRVHVGIPISQALVRAGDREDLHLMFSTYRLRPHQRIARDDMVELLETWAPSAPAGLRRLLTGGGSLPGHVAEIALVELANWDGRLPRPAGQDGARPHHDGVLSLAASLRRSPWRRLDLSLVTFGELDGAWSSPADTTGAAAEAARLAGGFLASDDVVGWTTFEPVNDLSIPDVLKGVLVLEGAQGRIERQARRLVVFEADDVVPWLVERPRVQLWEDTWLLAHQSVVDRLESLLADFARPGFRRYGPADLRGLPDGWSFFEGVQLVASPVELASGADDLLPLVPLSDSQVTVSGPRRLVGHGLFHRSSVLEVRATASGESDARLTLIPEFLFEDSGAGDGKEIELVAFEEASVVRLDHLALDDGDYRVLLRGKGRRLVTSATFRLRSAAHPVEPSPWLAEWLGHVPGSFGSAEVLPEDPAPPWLRGAEARGVVGRVAAYEPPPGLLGAIFGRPDDETGPAMTTTALTSSEMPCPPHRIELPPTDNEGKMPHRFKGHCRVCGLERWYRRGARRRKDADPTSRPSTVARWAAQVDASALPMTEDSGPSDADFLLDALITLGSGSWETFRRLADQVKDEPWAATEFARTFMALGHLEFAGSGASRRWAVNPPALVRVASGGIEGFLTGARNPRLITDLESVSGELGGRVSVMTQADAPSRVVVAAESDDDLALIASVVGIAYLHDAALDILGFAPRLAQIAFARPLAAPPTSPSVSRYDPTTGGWVTVPIVDGDGMYQLGLRPVRYVLVHQGRVFEVGNQVGKYAAAALAGVAAMAFDGAVETLVVPIGARLPGLVERAVVTCSGFAPVEVDGGRLAYVGVTSDVAAAAWGAVGPAAMRED